jgi:hypothetical protein
MDVNRVYYGVEGLRGDRNVALNGLEKMLHAELIIARRKLQEQKDQYEGYMTNLHEIIRQKHSEIKLLESRPKAIVHLKPNNEESIIYQYKLERLQYENKLLKSERSYADSSTQTDYEEPKGLELRSIFQEINCQIESVSVSIYEIMNRISPHTNAKIAKQVNRKNEKITYILVALSEIELLKTNSTKEVLKLETKRYNLVEDLKTLKVCYNDLLTKTISFEECLYKKDRIISELGGKVEKRESVMRELSKRFEDLKSLDKKFKIKAC